MWIKTKCFEIVFWVLICEKDIYIMAHGLKRKEKTYDL